MYDSEGSHHCFPNSRVSQGFRHGFEGNVQSREQDTVLLENHYFGRVFRHEFHFSSVKGRKIIPLEGV